MKIKLLTCLLVLLFALPLMAAPRTDMGRPANSVSQQRDNDTWIDANRILMFVTNHGNFGRDLSGYFGYDFGTWYPYGGRIDQIESGLIGYESPLYAAGLWIGATDQATGDTLIVISEYSSEYAPGPMQAGTFMEDRPEFRVYKLYRDSLANNPNQDYLDWPVDQGAPVNDDGTPEMIGDQMLWSVFNDADPDQHSNDAGETAPLGLEVKQTVFAFDREGSLGSIVFVRLRVYNKGGKTLENCFFSLWADPDLGGAGDDLVGCDTLTGLGFVYNDGNSDAQYTSIPSLGFDFFQGPLVETGDMDDIGRMWGQEYPGYTNLGMVSFNKYINGTDPDNYQQTYAYMNGLQGSEPGFPPYEYGGNVTLYQKSGDPVEGVGDIDDASADRRFMQSTGPITFAPDDSTEILAAIVIGEGSDNLNSISVMRDLDDYAQGIYERNFQTPNPPAKPIVTAKELPGQITLSWTDTSEVDPGDFTFEGYTVWQGQSSTGPWTELATYDLINDRTYLVDSVRVSGVGTPVPSVVKVGTNSGLSYHYETTRDKITNTDLTDLSEYFFRVTAFSFDYEYDVYDTVYDTMVGATFYDTFIVSETKTVPNGDRLLEAGDAMTLIPQAPPAGIGLAIAGYDTLDVTHTSAGPVLSDGAVQPIVLDPSILNGHTYRVIFEDVGGGAYTWDLEDVTAGVSLFESETNQSGDNDYFEVDGMVVKVLGPPVALKSYTYTAANPDDARPFTGVNWGGSGFFGGVGVLDEFFYTDLGPADVRAVEIRFVNPGEGQNAYLYDWNNSCAYDGFFPQDFEVWDVTPGSPERQINFAFVERNWDLPHTQRDSVFNPWSNVDDIAATPPAYDALGGREYFQIMASDYSATPLADYTLDGWFNSADDLVDYNGDILYGGWLHQRESADQVNAVPDSGDVWGLNPNYINLPVDTFTFVASAPNLTTNNSDLDNIKAVPNPFYLFGGYDTSPGSKVIKFRHLPERCTITIYNLSGEFVREIEKDDPATETAVWNALTEKGLPVASGIYIWVVEAPGFGQKIGKLAVFTEEEVLRIY